MNQESIFTNLPSEIIIDILLRLPIKTIITCKCVCKSWLKLLNTHDFTISHLSKSLPGLITISNSIEFFEFNDHLDLERHELHYNTVTKFDVNAFIRRTSDSPLAIEGSANGLLCLRKIHVQPDVLYVCNPITRDYIKLQCPYGLKYIHPTAVNYGFGASKITSQHKMVRIFNECVRDLPTNALLEISNSECHVYTLGTGSWREIACGDVLDYKYHSIGMFLNGNLNWLAIDSEEYYRISCFDLENERFNTFSPSPDLQKRRRFVGGLFVLGDCLCLCDNTPYDEIVIWLMKEYGAEKSWTKEYVIKKSPDIAGETYEVVRPLKVFKDGDILMAWGDLFLFYYSKRTKTIMKIDMFDMGGSVDLIVHTSSFISLKSFLPLENVYSF